MWHRSINRRQFESLRRLFYGNHDTAVVNHRQSTVSFPFIRMSRQRCMSLSLPTRNHLEHPHQKWRRKTILNRPLCGVSNVPTNEQKRNERFLLSKYDVVELEEYIYNTVTCTVTDPLLGQTLSSLQWLQKRISISYLYNENGEVQQERQMMNSRIGCTTITLRLQLRLPSLLHPKLRELQQLIQDNVSEQTQKFLVEKKELKESIVVNVEVIPIVQPPIPIMSRFVDDSAELLHNLGPGLTSVTHCIAVYSCKGGVGKSTVAVNLAYELAANGGRIGLLDLDLYGPSLPILVRPNDCTIRRSPLGTGLVHPINHENVKLLSLGFVNTHSGVPGSGQHNGASIMKGPMAVKVVSQLLKGTDWGALDVLVLDLPPGTGDVQLAVLQQLQLSGAIAVSTPSKLATSDTRKGIEMFNSLGVPTIAVVENMAYFEDDSGKRHYPFGKGFMDISSSPTTIGKEVKVVQLPISLFTNDANDVGVPLTISRPNDATAELTAYKLLSDIVSEELLRLQYGSTSQSGNIVLVNFDSYSDINFDVANVSLSLDKTKGDEKLIVRIFSDSHAAQFYISTPSDLRSRDPKTGDVIADSPYLAINENLRNEETHNWSPDHVVTITKTSGKRSPSAIPTRVERRGRYGFAVEWADGATIIYSMRSLAKAAGGKLKND
jgi:Mrp family chromosome partitioning ATPase